MILYKKYRKILILKIILILISFYKSRKSYVEIYFLNYLSY